MVSGVICPWCGESSAYENEMVCADCENESMMEQPGKDGFELHSIRCACGLCEAGRTERAKSAAEPTRPLFTYGICGIPMDDGDQRHVRFEDRGFYRSYTGFVESGLYRPGDARLDASDVDVRQIAAELEREAPVTGTVAFRLVDGKLVATLTSYVAFA